MGCDGWLNLVGAPQLSPINLREEAALLRARPEQQKHFAGGFRKPRTCFSHRELNPNSAAGRDGALRRPRAVPGAERTLPGVKLGDIRSARSARAGTA